MNEWGVVLVIIALVGLFTAVGKPIVSLISSITKLNSSVDSLNENLAKLGKENEKQHDELWHKNDEQDQMLLDHEKRIFRLER